MPIYEYSCAKCGEHMEVTQKISHQPLTRHPKCGGKLTKEWSRTGFQFKGSGWYVTDYAGKKTDAKESEETKPAETKAAATTDAKPKSEEKKTEAKPDKSKKKAPTSGAG